MKKLAVLSLLVVLISNSCKKLDDYEANNVEFEKTHFSIVEEITFEVPNDDFSVIPGVFQCMDLGIFGPIDHEAFITTQNPNPYAHLTYDIRPKDIQMELTNIFDCDFDMLESVEIYVVLNGVTNSSQFVLQDPQNTSAAHNAVLVSQFQNIPSGIGNTLNMQVNQDAVLDQFIYAGTFQTYALMTFDKAFTDDFALLKTTMELDVTLINEP